MGQANNKRPMKVRSINHGSTYAARRCRKETPGGSCGLCKAAINKRALIDVELNRDKINTRNRASYNSDSPRGAYITKASGIKE